METQVCVCVCVCYIVVYIHLVIIIMCIIKINPLFFLWYCIDETNVQFKDADRLHFIYLTYLFVLNVNFNNVSVIERCGGKFFLTETTREAQETYILQVTDKI
jgi:hypothetical protein